MCQTSNNMLTNTDYENLDQNQANFYAVAKYLEMGNLLILAAKLYSL